MAHRLTLHLLVTSNHKTLRAILIRVEWLLITQFGFDPRKTLRSLHGLPRYLKDLFRFRANFNGRIELVPCLHDWHEEGGSTKSEYFWQDLLVARLIFDARPQKHVDVGSRVDGFVSHVASFREIEVFDIRPITTHIPGVIFKQADFMHPEGLFGNGEYCDSLSCLHALEHFGLGRYGDPIDPRGFEHGLANMGKLLKPNGVFYLSVPIGVERVEFNGNRVFDPRTIINLASQSSLVLSRLTTIRGDGTDQQIINPTLLADLANQRYTLALFEFVKQANEKLELLN